MCSRTHAGMNVISIVRSWQFMITNTRENKRKIFNQLYRHYFFIQERSSLLPFLLLQSTSMQNAVLPQSEDFSMAPQQQIVQWLKICQVLTKDSDLGV